MHLTLSIAGHGHHPSAWRVSSLATQAPSIPRYAELAARMEAGLLDGIFFVPPASASGASSLGAAAHPGAPWEALDSLQPDATPLIGSLVARTGHIGLGASVPMAHTEPFHTARAFAVLDNLSAGRTALLCDLRRSGADDANFAHAASLDADAHYERAEEYLGVAMRLWDSWEDGAVVVDKAAGIFADSDKIHAIHHAGAYFTVRGPLTAVRPRQGHPVIVVDDMSAPGRRLAAGYADVFVGACQSMAQAAALADDLRGQTAARGRAPDALCILMTICPILAESEAQARAREAQLESMNAAGAPPPAGHRFTGTAEGLCDLMGAWYRAGVCDGFNIAPAVLPDDAARLVDGVVPLLQRQGLFRTRYHGTTLREQLELPRPINSFSGQTVNG